MSPLEDSLQVVLPRTQSPFSADDILKHVFSWLPAPTALGCGRVSKAFRECSLDRVQRATWDNAAAGSVVPSAPGLVAHSFLDRVASDIDGWRRDLGTPCLDFRASGNAVSCKEVLGLIKRAFSERRRNYSPTATISACDSPCGADEDYLDGVKRPQYDGMTNSTGSAASSWPREGETPALRGLAVCSEAITDEGLQEVLEACGNGLELLDLAGCRSLTASKTASLIARTCTSLVSLNLSGTCVGPHNGQSVPGLVRASPPQDDGKPSRGDSLLSLLRAVGPRLEYLRLCDCANVTLEGIRGVASFCTKLKELDLGSLRGGHALGQRRVTGLGLEVLSEAPCAASLVSLGLRNQYHLRFRGSLDALADSRGTTFVSLRRLDMAGLHCLNDEVLGLLASALSLTHIDLSRAIHVTDTGIAKLATGSPELISISVHGTDITDHAVSSLCAGCPELRALNASMTKLTERSLKTLAKRSSLRWVNVRCCYANSHEALRTMRNLRSRLCSPRLLRDRGVVLGMERPQGRSGSRIRFRPPTRAVDTVDLSEDIPRRIGVRPHERTREFAGRTETRVRGADGLHESLARANEAGSEPLGLGASLQMAESPATTGSLGRSRNHDVRIGNGGFVGHAPGGQSEPPGATSSPARRADDVPSRDDEVGSTSAKGQEERAAVPRVPASIGDFALSNRDQERPSTTAYGRLAHTARAERAKRDGSRSKAGEKGEHDTSGVVPFDWNAVPRGGGVGGLGAWSGFRGLSGDLVRDVIEELHPFVEVSFAKNEDHTIPSRKKKHGYAVHTSKFGLAWVELRVDELGCVV